MLHSYSLPNASGEFYCARHQIEHRHYPATSRSIRFIDLRMIHHCKPLIGVSRNVDGGLCMAGLRPSRRPRQYKRARPLLLLAQGIFRVAESQAGVRPVTGRPDSPGLPGRPARSDKLMLLNNLLKIHG